MNNEQWAMYWWNIIYFGFSIKKSLLLNHLAIFLITTHSWVHDTSLFDLPDSEVTVLLYSLACWHLLLALINKVYLTLHTLQEQYLLCITKWKSVRKKKKSQSCWNDMIFHYCWQIRVFAYAQLEKRGQ